MLKKIKITLLAISLTGLYGCSKNETTIIKEADVSANQSVLFKREIFILNKSDLPLLKNFNDDKKEIEKFNNINFNKIEDFNSINFKLSNELLSKKLNEKRIDMFNIISDVKNKYKLEVNEELRNIELSSIEAKKALEMFEKETAIYLKDVNKVIALKSLVEEEIKNSDERIELNSKELVSKVNQAILALGEKEILKKNHFTKLFEHENCIEDIEIKSKSINFYNLESNSCVFTYIPISNKKSKDLMENDDLIDLVIKNLKNTHQELISRGEIKSNRKETTNDILNKYDIEIEKEYLKSAKKYFVTRYQLENKKRILNEIIKEKKTEFLSELEQKESKFKNKMKYIDLNKYKGIEKEEEFNYLKLSRDNLLSKKLEFTPQNINEIKINEIDDNKNLFIVIDKYNKDNSNFTDIILINLSELKSDENIDSSLKEKILLDEGISLGYIYRFGGKEEITVTENAIIKSIDIIKDF